MGFIKKVVGGVGKAIGGIFGIGKKEKPPQRTTSVMPRIPVESGVIGFTRSTRHMGPFGVGNLKNEGLPSRSFGGMEQPGMGSMGGFGGMPQRPMRMMGRGGIMSPSPMAMPARRNRF